MREASIEALNGRIVTCGTGQVAFVDLLCAENSKTRCIYEQPRLPFFPPSPPFPLYPLETENKKKKKENKKKSKESEARSRLVETRLA